MSSFPAILWVYKDSFMPLMYYHHHHYYSLCTKVSACVGEYPAGNLYVPQNLNVCGVWDNDAPNTPPHNIISNRIINIL